MVLGMANTTKITITLPNDQLKQVRARVRKRRTDSVSAFVKHAVKIALNDAKEWEQALEDALLQTGGPMTDAEREWADSILFSDRPKKKARKRKAA
jgi:Arc/MetJ-type ribon-helix-helix transcriptional regulator